MGPQNYRNGKYSDPMIIDFRALLDNTQDSAHGVSTYNSMREYIKHMTRNKTYMSDEQQPTMGLCIDHDIKVQVERLVGERICQMCESTGSQSWHGGD